MDRCLIFVASTPCNLRSKSIGKASASAKHTPCWSAFRAAKKILWKKNERSTSLLKGLENRSYLLRFDVLGMFWVWNSL